MAAWRSIETQSANKFSDVLDHALCALSDPLFFLFASSAGEEHQASAGCHSNWNRTPKWDEVFYKQCFFFSGKKSIKVNKQTSQACVDRGALEPLLISQRAEGIFKFDLREASRLLKGSQLFWFLIASVEGAQSLCVCCWLQISHFYDLFCPSVLQCHVAV